MEAKVSPTVKQLTEEVVDKENVSTARVLDARHEDSTDGLQTRLGILLGRLAERTALPPEKAASILENIRKAARK
jgi:hypothetical protein